MKYRCVVTDLDSTVLGKDGILSFKTQEAIIKLIENGIVFIPASGRSYYSFPQQIMGIPGIEYVIASNGASIYRPSNHMEIFGLKLPEQIVYQLFDLLEQEWVTFEVFIQGQAYTELEYYLDPLKYGVSRNTVEYLQSTRKPQDNIKEFIVQNIKNIDCIDVIVNPKEQERITGLISNKIKNAYITTSVGHLIEISHKDAGKHNAIRYLSKILKIQLEEIVAFGDGDNDSEMLREVGLGVAMENGSKKCKQAADRETIAHDQEGVLMVLNQIFSDILQKGD